MIFHGIQPVTVFFLMGLHRESMDFNWCNQIYCNGIYPSVIKRFPSWTAPFDYDVGDVDGFNVLYDALRWKVDKVDKVERWHSLKYLKFL